MSVRLRRYAASIAATKYTHSKLPAGAANLAGGPLDKHDRVQQVWTDFSAWLNTQEAAVSNDNRTSIAALLAKLHGAGNCGEQASVAYVYLTS